MVVNMNLYTPGMTLAQLPDGLLWIAELLPGMAPIRDVTDVLRAQGYWGSYNVPYFTETYEACGDLAVEQKYGAIASYTKYARAQLIKRQQANITDLAGVQKLIRYNEWQTDPLSECPGCSPKGNPMLTLAARKDLIPANGTWGPWLQGGVFGSQLAVAQPFGAYDAKVTSYTLFTTRFAGYIQSGPTHDAQPAFDWRTAPQAASWSHLGQPDLFDFDWVFTPTLFDN
jgi:hypothetical protein